MAARAHAMEHKDASELDRIPFYYSRPDLRPPRLNILTRDDALATRGLLFVSPTFTGDYRPDSGPYIFDTNGTLIWSGPSATSASGAANVHDLHPCTYRGAPHLCLWQGEQRGTHGTGVGVILDEHYEVVRTVHPRGTAAGGPGVDFHEFRLLSGPAALGGGDSALIVTYGPRFVGGTWVLDSCFAEVPLGRSSGGGDEDEDDGSSSFVWCATDHIPLADNPGQSDFERSAGGNGRVPDRAWDYAHINSVDKSPTGREYLVSARHLDTIYCVSAVDGSILWRLAGSDAAAKSSSSSSSSPAFRLDNNWHFARQHDARFLDNDGDDRDNNNNSSLTVSFFNNANDGVALRNNPSSAVIARLDLATMTATKLAEYGDVPLLATTTGTGTGTKQTHLSSNGMGSVQSLSHPLSNGSSRRHILASFGRHGAMAEYDAGSSPSDRSRKDPIFYADFAAPAALPAASRWSASNYRTYLLPAAEEEEEEEEPPNPSTFSPDHPNNNNNKGTPSSSSLSAAGTWTGHPIAARPALWSYSRTPTDLQTFYVSWNGDTAARTYKFWISDVDDNNNDNNNNNNKAATTPLTPPPAHTFHVAGTVARAGFETNLTIGSARPWAYAEALDARGRSLANSTVVRNYVPSPEDAAACGRWHCFPDVAASAPAEWLLPLDDGAALAGGAGAGGAGAGGASRVPGTLALLEHILALCGLGFLALWLWMRMRRGSRDKKGYRPVGKEEGLEQSQYDGLKV